MASVAEFIHLMPAYLLLRPLVKFMTRGATDVGHGMTAGIPVLQDGRRRCRVTLQADQGLRLSRDFVELQQGFMLTPVLGACFFEFGEMFDRQTSRTVTGFTIDQGEAGRGSNLFTMDRGLKVPIDLIMGMTFGQTVFITDIVGIQSPDNELLIFLDREKLVVLAKIIRLVTRAQNHHQRKQESGRFQCLLLWKIAVNSWNLNRSQKD